ncbi:MAG: DUF971 domain-containing protein [Planctomycetaceae bacterium]
MANIHQPGAAMNDPIPVSLKAVDDALQITWSDGVSHRLTWRLLRDACPCAGCRDERARRESAAVVSRTASAASPPRAGATPQAGAGAGAGAGADLLPVLSLAEARPLRVQSMKPVGNYAYGIDFTDGHTTGIYTLEHLRELGEAARA